MIVVTSPIDRPSISSTKGRTCTACMQVFPPDAISYEIGEQVFYEAEIPDDGVENFIHLLQEALHQLHGTPMMVATNSHAWYLGGEQIYRLPLLRVEPTTEE